MESEEALLAAARALAGRTLGELGARVGLVVPEDLRRDKGFVGRLIERCLGVGGNASAPDFERLGVELKTLPVVNGAPVESTFVATLDPSDAGALTWETSPVRHKLARVLWVPVEADRRQVLASRRVGSAMLWSPDASEADALRADFDTIAELIAEGLGETVTAHVGTVLQLRPKGADARSLRWTRDDDGAPVRTPPRAFYLRRTFTEQVVRRLWL